MSTDAPIPLPEEGADAENALRQAQTQVHVPRITIKYCTQCQWMLRAAYVCAFTPSSLDSDVYLRLQPVNFLFRLFSLLPIDSH